MALFIIITVLLVTVLALTVTWGGLTNEEDAPIEARDIEVSATKRVRI